MSWHFSQALVAAYSVGTCSAGAQSAPLSGSHTHALYCAPDRMKAFSRLSRFGMTCEPLTDDLGEAVLTWCLEASPAKTSPRLAKAPESMESDQECGRTWRESFARWDRDSCSWRTPQCSLLEGLDVFSATWPQWGMMRGGECSVQSMPGHLTSGIASGFLQWPTPTQGMWKQDVNDNGEYAQRVLESGFQVMLPAAVKIRSNSELSSDEKRSMLAGNGGQPVQTALMDAVKMWPTPRTPSGGADNSANKTRPSGHKGTTNLLGAVKMWPTPVSRMWKDSGSPSEYNRNEVPLAAQVGGQLNPTWVEWLMGWPLGWTDLKPLETDKYPQWRHSHGNSSPETKFRHP